MQSLKDQLDEDEALDRRQGRTPLHAMSPGAFLESAIQIEEQQYVLHHPLVCIADPSP